MFLRAFCSYFVRFELHFGVIFIAFLGTAQASQPSQSQQSGATSFHEFHSNKVTHPFPFTMAFGYLQRGRRAGVKTRAEEARKQFNIPVICSPRLQYANPHLTRGVNLNNLVAVSKMKPSCLNQALVHSIPRVMLANTTSNLNPTSPTYQETFNLHLLSEDSLNIQSNTSRLENYLRVDTRVCLQRDNVRENSLRDNVRDRGVNYNNLRYINCSNAKINTGKCLQFCIWNAQSLRNKTSVLHDYLCHKDIDICAITES